MRTVFYQYTEDCFKQLLNSLEAYGRGIEKQHLNHYRVCIKKIRVSIACMAGKNDDHFSGSREHLRKAFRKGGRLREYKLYEDWFRRNHFPALRTLTGIKEEITELNKAFLSDTGKMIKEMKDVRKQVLPPARHLGTDQVYAYYVTLIKNELPLPLGFPAPPEWHLLRKKIKRVLYARHWQEGKGLSLISGNQARFLDRLQRLIGNWHDAEEMIGWLKKSALKKQWTETDKAQLELPLECLYGRSAYYATQVNEKLVTANAVFRPLVRRLAKLNEEKDKSRSEV